MRIAYFDCFSAASNNSVVAGRPYTPIESLTIFQNPPPDRRAILRYSGGTEMSLQPL